jgi:hypothetical protein
MVQTPTVVEMFCLACAMTFGFTLASLTALSFSVFGTLTTTLEHVKSVRSQNLILSVNVIGHRSWVTGVTGVG